MAPGFGIGGGGGMVGDKILLAAGSDKNFSR